MARENTETTDQKKGDNPEVFERLSLWLINLSFLAISTHGRIINGQIDRKDARDRSLQIDLLRIRFSLFDWAELHGVLNIPAF
jgi:hypothetical protein